MNSGPRVRLASKFIGSRILYDLMFSEDDLLPLSALQHLRFCERQWGLIHLEQQWEENRITAEGRLLHDRVHEAATEARPGLVIARGLYIRCLRLGLSGQADAVEFHRASPDEPGTVALPDRLGRWRPFPVEYKRGRPKSDACDEIQLCAQALCLEEMFETNLPEGALFYGQPRRRLAVPFTPELRQLTESLCRRMRELHSLGVTPPAEFAKRCNRCSLISLCLPKLPAGNGMVARYLASALRFEDPDL